ncbi:hypothetical protein A4R35_21455 [Thermogemmatispora tikiterensis]|uniref:Bacterial transcriptional activator domain-containing protein n=1 Tax=Thermogemmatispora tikiterensis TaxID=1825093 RepID=A0A328VPK9_9CHLR|nr:hypothetical protein A4R35_21455 [Thermogemmatispora tikiterensis]
MEEKDVIEIDPRGDSVRQKRRESWLVLRTFGWLTVQGPEQAPRRVWSSRVLSQGEQRGIRRKSLSSYQHIFALLAALLCQPERLATREDLQEWLFGDYPPRKAAARLDDTASRLRCLLRSVAPEVEPDRLFWLEQAGVSRAYRIAPYPTVWLDVDAFLWYMEQASRFERFGEQGLALVCWERAFQLGRRGAFLTGCYAPWLEARRELLEGLLSQCVQALVRCYLHQGGIAQAELYLRLLLERQPENEDAFRLLVELLGERGAYQEIEISFGRLQEALGRVGRRPEPQTEELVAYLCARPLVRWLAVPHLRLQTSQAHQRSGELRTGCSVGIPSEPSTWRSSCSAVPASVESQQLRGVKEESQDMPSFDYARRELLRALHRMAVALGAGAVGTSELLQASKELRQPVALSKASLDLDLLSLLLNSLEKLLQQGEHQYVLTVTQSLYERWLAAPDLRDDTEMASWELRLGLLMACALEYVLSWYQRAQRLIDFYDELEGRFLRVGNLKKDKERLHAAQLLARRGRHQRVLWHFDEAEQACQEGLQLLQGQELSPLWTHFLCEYAHLAATRGDENLWLQRLDAARSSVLALPGSERAKALNQITYMQGEGYKRLAFHLRKPLALARREQAARLAYQLFQEWNGLTIELPGFESLVMQVSRAQCLILLDPAAAIEEAQRLILVVQDHYPTLLGKLSRLIWLAEQRLQMGDAGFLTLLQEGKTIAYSAGYQLL